jgi:hypothetical protein
LRLKAANLTVNKPDLSVIKSGKTRTFLDIGEKRSRDKNKFPKQKQEALHLESSGLNNVKYRIISRHELIIDNFSCLLVDVEIYCDKLDTHWCSFGFQFED